MTTLELNCCDPTNPDNPYPKQAQYLNLDRQGRSKTRSHWVGGRGSSKTTSGILLMIKACLQWNIGLPHLWTEPTYKLCNDVFVREFKQLVPKGLYTFNKSDMRIDWVNGSSIDIRSRNVDNPNKDMNRGPNYAGGVDDEQAQKCNIDTYWDTDAAIRHPKAKCLFHDTLSTPKMNDYFKLAHTEGHNLVEATSYDNPYLPPGWAEDLAKGMSKRRMEQEVLGAWTALTGLIWDEWSSDKWPAGNIYPDYEHDHNLPYYLFFDLGVGNGSWIIVQRLFENGHDVFVATAEYLPKRDGSADRLCRLIKQDYGTPSLAVCGADVNTRSQGSADTPMMFIRNHFGMGVPVTPVSGWIASKEIQHAQLSYLIKDTRAIRRFTVAEHFRSKPEEHNRGIIEMMNQDAWGDDNKARRGEFLPKEHRLEHVRDALLYGAVATMAVPDYSLHANHAA